MYAAYHAIDDGARRPVPQLPPNLHYTEFDSSPSQPGMTCNSLCLWTLVRATSTSLTVPQPQP